MSKFDHRLDAALLVLVEAKDGGDGFTYDHYTEDMWRKLVRKARDDQGIDFDTENDEPVAQRVVKVDQDEWDFTDCKFNCELRMAGGDWESPVAYFRCQLVKGYADGMSQSSNPYFIFIPGKDQGNQHLVKTKSGWAAPTDDNQDDGLVEPDHKLCWRSLSEHLDGMVGREIEKVRKHRQPTGASDGE